LRNIERHWALAAGMRRNATTARSCAWANARRPQLPPRGMLWTASSKSLEVAFDRIDGNLLKGRRAQPAPSQIHRALAHHMLRCGAPIAWHSFWLHLSLDYGVPPTGCTPISPLSWMVDQLLLIESGKGQHVLLGTRRLVRRQGTLPF